MTIGNSTQFNDYFEGLIFGNTVTFALAFSGPALTSPNGTAMSGSTFGIGFYDSTPLNPILTTNVTDGFAGIINVNLDGTRSKFRTCVSARRGSSGGGHRNNRGTGPGEFLMPLPGN